MSQTKAQLISDLVQALNFTGTASAPANGAFLSAANTLALATNSAQRLTIDSTGRVLVGTTTPDPFGNRQLTVASSSSTHLEIRSGTSASGIIVFTDGTSGGTDSFKGQIKYNQASDFMTFETNGSNERLRIDSSGKVGIGTSSPETLLHAKINTFSDDINKVALTLSNNQSSGVHQYFQNASTGTGVSNGARIGLGNTDNFLIQHFEAKDIQISTNATERMRINSSGNVGIGTSSPGETLHILKASANHGIKLERTTSNAGSVLIQCSSFGVLALTADNNIQYKSGGSQQHIFYKGSDEIARFDTSKRLLIGTSSGTGHSLTGTNNPLLQVESASSNDYARASFIFNGATSIGPGLWFGKSRGTSVGSNTIVNDGDQCGGFFFHAADGTDKHSRVASIEVKVDGTPGSNDTPGRITFATTADGASGTTERLRIDSSGDLILANTFNSNSDITPCFSIGSSAASRPGIVIRGSTTNKGDISFCDNSGSDSSDGVSEGLIRYDHSDDSMHFHTADDERLRITSGGRIGINTSDPQLNGKGLHIQGANVPNSHYDTYVGLIVENPEGRIQIVSNNDGNQASQLTLTNAPTSGDNLHWIIEHSAASSSNSFHIGHKTSSGGYPGSVLDTGNFDVDFRILTNGVSQFTTTGVFDTYSTAANAFQFRHDFTNVTLLWLSNTNTSHTKELLRLDSARAGSSSFFLANFTTGNLSDDQFLFRGDGNAYQDGGTTWSTPADYAEMFEWEDGNPDNEDRRGISVVLVGDKIRAATSSDDTSQIIGVISGNPAVTGDGAYTKWHLKYLLDDYNNYILDENNERKLNPDYDPTKTYIPREDRKEWSAVGMLGKLRVKVNQPVGANWIKLKNISDTVEQWLVR